MLKQIILYKTKEVIDIQETKIDYFLPYRRKEKIKTLLINNQHYLSQRDKIIYICDSCKKELKANFDYNEIFMQDEHCCKGCQIKQTKKELYGDENYNNHKKTEQTNIKRYGYKTALHGKEIKRQGMLRKYGVEHNMQLKEVREKVQQTWIKKYGTDEILKQRSLLKEGMYRKYGVYNAFQSDEIKNKIKQTNLERYGVEHLMKDPERARKTQEKLQKTMIDKYGAKCSIQVPEVYNKIAKTKTKNNSWGRGGRCKWYLVEDHKVQGLFELKVAQFLIDNDIEFISHGLKGIRYKDKNDKQRYYYPDFYLPKYDLYLEPHAKYFWNDKFMRKMSEIEKQVNIIYFDESFNLENLPFKK